MKNEIPIEDLQRVDLRVGTIRKAYPNAKARKPAYVLEIDFGELGPRTSSAQLVADYDVTELEGRQIVAAFNLPMRKVAGVRSEVLVLAAVCADGRTRLLEPDSAVPDGTSVA